VHAVELLGALGAADGVDPMLEVFTRTPVPDPIHEKVLVVLPGLGRVVLEPALRAYAESSHDETRDSICAILAELGVRDARIYELLLAQLPRTPLDAASNLQHYGDERAIPHLARALEEWVLGRSDGLFTEVPAVVLAQAITRLGGTLTDVQRQNRDDAQALLDARWAVRRDGTN
jgi:hypothetical protein